MLELRNVSTHYGKIQALHDVSVEIKEGEIVTLIGANGAGKTTLLMTLCGEPKPSSGSIWFEGEQIDSLSTARIMRKDIAVVPEGRRIFARLTVQENLLMGAFFVDKAEQPALLDQVFTMFPRLHERLEQRAGTMSGGEQQMLAIGRALMTQPKLLMLDEPSLGLAPFLVAEIFDIVQRINRQEGLSVLLVEQNAIAALEVVSHGYLLENGRIVMHDSAEAMKKNPDIQEFYLGGSEGKNFHDIKHYSRRIRWLS